MRDEKRNIKKDKNATKLNKEEKKFSNSKNKIANQTLNKEKRD